MLALVLASSHAMALKPPPKLTRHQLLLTTTALLAPSPLSADDATDPYTHSAFLGLAPPPIKGTWTEAELLGEARAGNVASVQLAVQHDVVVAVDRTHGHRYACLIKDADLGRFLLDAVTPQGTLPFEVLPPAEWRVALRSFAIRFAWLTLATWSLLAALLWDARSTLDE